MSARCPAVRDRVGVEAVTSAFVPACELGAVVVASLDRPEDVVAGREASAD